LNILTLNTEAFGGGANQIALSLFQHYKSSGHTSKFINALHQSTDLEIECAPNDASRNLLFRFLRLAMEHSLRNNIRFMPKLLGWLLAFSEPVRYAHRLFGHDDFFQPSTKHIPFGRDSNLQVIHAHNLFGGYFDLRQLPRISRQVPFIWTLHDMWAFTGHCSHPLDCRKWLAACGGCPYLSLPPAIESDGTTFNLKQKKRIYQSSTIHIATPSRWLLDHVEKSVLQPGIGSCRVIPNGVDQEAFCQGDKDSARQELGIPVDASVLLFVAAGNRDNPWKDYQTLEATAKILAAHLAPSKLILMVPGLSEQFADAENLLIHNIPWIKEKTKLAKYYQAADLYLHAAHAENFPNVIIEALSCGLPVIGTRTGGIPEQIVEGKNGFVVSQGDAEAMASHALGLLTDRELLTRFSNDAASKAKGVYSLERMGNEYLGWFEELLEAS